MPKPKLIESPEMKKSLNIKNLPDEEWKEWPETDGNVLVSNFGRVKKMPHKLKGPGKLCTEEKILRQAQSKSRSNYFKISISYDGKRIVMLVHRMVAILFIPNPENKPCVNHKDGDKLNNNVSNLEWVSYKENTQHAIREGLLVVGKGKRNRILVYPQVWKIRERARNGENMRQIARDYGVSPSCIYGIVNRRTYTDA